MYPNFEGLPFFPVQRHPSPLLSSSPHPSPRSIVREGFEQRNVRTTSLPHGSPRWGKIQSKKDAANIARTWAGGVGGGESCHICSLPPWNRRAGGRGRTRALLFSLPRENISRLSPSLCQPSPSAHPSPSGSSITHPPSHGIPSARRPTDARTHPPSVGASAAPEGAPQSATAAAAARATGEKKFYSADR